MASTVVIVNGLPGSGKTTLARELAPLIGGKLVSHQRIREAIGDALGRGIPSEIADAVAMESMWATVARIEGTVVLDRFWFGPDHGAMLQAELVRLRPQQVVEIWCDVPIAEAQMRAALQRRNAKLATPTAADWESWSTATPVSISPVVRVDTRNPVHVPQLADAVMAGAPRG